MCLTNSTGLSVELINARQKIIDGKFLTMKLLKPISSSAPSYDGERSHLRV